MSVIFLLLPLARIIVVCAFLYAVCVRAHRCDRDVSASLLAARTRSGKEAKGRTDGRAGVLGVRTLSVGVKTNFLASWMEI